jgi:hypothetical protein
LGEAFTHLWRASAMRPDVFVDAPVQRGGVIRSGMPALHQLIARIQALVTHEVGTLDVVQDILESRLAGAHLRPNTIKRRRGEQAEGTDAQRADARPSPR